VEDQITREAKRPRRKDAKKQEARDAKTIKVNLSISADGYRRLFIAAAMQHVPASAIVESLIQEHTGWAIPAARVKTNDRHVVHNIWSSGSTVMSKLQRQEIPTRLQVSMIRLISGAISSS
jgi:hypothetical protein